VLAVRGVTLVNLQKRHAVRVRAVLFFAQALRRHLRLGKRKFNICLMDDAAVRKLNFRYRGKDKATDVLSFSWDDVRSVPASCGVRQLGDRNRIGTRDFIGEIMISVPAALRNAAGEGHSTLNEIRWLILHGALHLLGYDHENDSGEMTRLELALREQLGVAGVLPRRKRVNGRKANRKD
jgi:probable rRNA maturation factor